MKDSLTANFFTGKPVLGIEKLQEDGRGIFVVLKKVTEFIVILICKVYPLWCLKGMAVLYLCLGSSVGLSARLIIG